MKATLLGQRASLFLTDPKLSHLKTKRIPAFEQSGLNTVGAHTHTQANIPVQTHILWHFKQNRLAGQKQKTDKTQRHASTSTHSSAPNSGRQSRDHTAAQPELKKKNIYILKTHCHTHFPAPLRKEVRTANSCSSRRQRNSRSKMEFGRKEGRKEAVEQKLLCHREEQHNSSQKYTIYRLLTRLQQCKMENNNKKITYFNDCKKTISGQFSVHVHTIKHVKGQTLNGGSCRKNRRAEFGF